MKDEEFAMATIDTHIHVTNWENLIRSQSVRSGAIQIIDFKKFYS